MVFQLRFLLLPLLLVLPSDYASCTLMSQVLPMTVAWGFIQRMILGPA